MYVDQIESTRKGRSAPALGGDMADQPQASEAVSRFVAYSSGYLFWGMVAGLSATILIMN